MKIKQIFPILLPVILLMLFSFSCTDMGDDLGSYIPPSTNDTTYWSDVSPIFQIYCVGCHGGTNGLYLDTYQNTLTTGNHAPIVIPSDAESSLLLRVLIGTSSIIPLMPPGGPLMDINIASIRDWIDDGALNDPTTP